MKFYSYQDCLNLNIKDLYRAYKKNINTSQILLS